jgi:hypothetical protein
MNHVADIFPPTKQRPALLAFSKACGTRPSALRRDECNDWAIFGSNGHIYAGPEGFQLMIRCDYGNQKWSSARGWESDKGRLKFGKVTQDGDCEGSIITDRLPSKAEAAHIRDKPRTMTSVQVAKAGKTSIPRQPRRSSAIEAAVQAMVGLPIGFIVTYAVEPLHMPPTYSAATITLAMFLISPIRGYAIGRRFERRVALNECRPRI